MQDLEVLLNQALAQVEVVESIVELEQIRNEYFSKKGKFVSFLQLLRDVEPGERPKVGQQINLAKERLENALNEKKQELKKAELAKKLANETIDVSLPAVNSLGALHPVTQTINRITNFFSELGFEIVTGPEIENAYYNFDALNIPLDHPARNEQDTFWFDAQRLLRTQTSGVQIRTMEKSEPPLRIVSPGRVYRNDYDSTHTPMFHQVELLLVSKTANFCELKGLIHNFLSYFFEKDLQIRFRPSFFPFTEPSAEVDILGANGSWLEVLGCGMVHPKVLSNVGIDPNEYQGFAAGLGVERLAMLRHQINDLRMFFENDLRFLKQFK